MKAFGIVASIILILMVWMFAAQLDGVRNSARAKVDQPAKRIAATTERAIAAPTRPPQELRQAVLVCKDCEEIGMPANIWRGPSGTSGVICRLPWGKKVSVVEDPGGHYVRIKAVTCSGWISRDLMRTVATTAASSTVQPAATGDPIIKLPTPTPSLLTTATANSAANLRDGPGTDYPIVGGATAGQALDVGGRNAGGDWLQLADGAWIAAFLVNGAPERLPVLEATVAPTATAVKKARPTATRAPVRAAAPSNCDPSYPTLCIPIGIGDLDCGDIGARNFRVVGADPHRFDKDRNGVGCES